MTVTPLWIDLILLLVVAEAVIILFAGRKRAGLVRLLPTLVAGFFLLAGVRAALTESHTLLIFALTMALVAHLLDMALTLGRDTPVSATDDEA